MCACNYNYTNSWFSLWFWFFLCQRITVFEGFSKVFRNHSICVIIITWQFWLVTHKKRITIPEIVTIIPEIVSSHTDKHTVFSLLGYLRTSKLTMILHTIGRSDSDNIDDLLSDLIDWENDALVNVTRSGKFNS